MEGNADKDQDGKITLGEMQEFLTEMVGRQALSLNRKQQPQVFGSPTKVLVGE
jgi:Ca2+-binding EF-hand superfamily protein